MAKSVSLNVFTSQPNAKALIEKIQDQLCDVLFNTGALTIGTGVNSKVKIANTIYALIDGALVRKTTAEIVLSGTVTADMFNVYVLSMNAAGTVTATMGTEGATIGALVFPAVPTDEVVIGFCLVNPTGTGNFVGGTTALDDGTVVPNAVYVDTPYPFNANSLSL